MKTFFPVIAGVACFAASFVARDVHGDAPATPAQSTSASVSREDGVRAFAQIANVLQSPRCMNCHPVGDAPLNGDHAAVHRMNISRKSTDGLNCTTCHRNENGKDLHSPPGVPNWRLPPEKTPMVFQGKSPRDLCEQLKDPARNGEKSLAALHEHFDHDAIVMWGWSPGPGRTLPPIAHDELMKNVDAWLASGAVCPN